MRPERSFDVFEPFSPVHVGVVLLFALVWWLAIASARRGERSAIRRGELIFATAGLAAWFAIVGYFAAPSRFDPAYSLPIQICDLTALLAPLAFFFHARPLYALLYFWGIGLSLQGVITPVLHAGPARLEFWLFWGHHALVVGTAMYVIVVRGYRPSSRDLVLAAGLGLAYIAVIIPVNLVFDYNYGFIGNAEPSQPTLIDVLGPWPWRVFVIVALALLEMWLLYLPWWIAERRREAAAQRTRK